jgi:arylsulfatase A-like enzyme
MHMPRRLLIEIIIGFVAGLLAGPALGLGEWLAITRIAGPADTGALGFAVAAYAVVAALFGAGLGIFGAFLLERQRRRQADRRPPPAWARLARYWAIDLGLIGVVVARFRIVRDVFDEQLKLLSAPGLLVHAGLIAGLLALVGLVWWLTRGASGFHRQSAPTAPATHSSAAPAPSRRQFLKTALTAGFVVAPPVAALGRLLGPSANTAVAPSVIRTTGVLPAALRGRPNVIYLMIDTLRADYLSCYGYPQPISPRIDQLAAAGVRFHNHFAQASWTKPCVACQLTSMYPSSHRAVNKVDRLPDGVTSLPETLARHGYAAAGFAANANIAPLFNFGQGFHAYEYLAPTALFGASESASQLAVYQGLRLANERFVSSAKSVYNFYYPAEAINQRAFDWMRRHLDQRFFLFLHYMDPHDPYFEHPYNGYGIARVGTPNPPADMAEEVKRLYVGEIAYLDRQLGELFDWLKQQGIYDNTLIVLTSDHGEEFHEHGGWWHGLTLYEEQIRVPLILKLPDRAAQRPGTVDDHLAQSIDIAPTVLGLLGLDRPADMQGVHLFNPDERIGMTFAENELEGNVLRSVRGAQWKLVEANAGNPRGLPAQQLFDLTADPGELRDLAAGEPDGVTQLLADMNRIQQWAAQRAVATQQADIDAATREQLRNIGY